VQFTENNKLLSQAGMSACPTWSQIQQLSYTFIDFSNCLLHNYLLHNVYIGIFMCIYTHTYNIYIQYLYIYIAVTLMPTDECRCQQ
jgi:hypothetical protein